MLGPDLACPSLPAHLHPKALTAFVKRRPWRILNVRNRHTSRTQEKGKARRKDGSTGYVAQLLQTLQRLAVVAVAALQRVRVDHLVVSADLMYLCLIRVYNYYYKLWIPPMSSSSSTKESRRLRCTRRFCQANALGLIGTPQSRRSARHLLQ